MKNSNNTYQKQDLTFNVHNISVNLDANLAIDYINNKLSIYNNSNPKANICVDFNSGKLLHSLKFTINKSHPLAKATNISNIKRPLHVLDATAGLGKDAMIFAKLGLKVFMLERCKILHALLKDGILRAREHIETKNIINNVRLLRTQNSVVFMQRLSKLVDAGNFALQPDIIYLDPMFPKKNKAALVKKEMQILQLLHGEATDAEELLDPAIKLTKYRVIVKRPAKANFFNNKKPSFQIIGKTCRYDVYTRGR
jgi:16S rRNA (guanine1516-N2)-methyltransferase